MCHQLDLPQKYHIPFLKTHNQVVRPHIGGANPYHIGFELFKKIEESLRDDKYDNVVANILSDTIINISPNLKKLTRKRLAISGILIDQVERVIDAYSNWICLKVSDRIDNWVLIDGEL